MSMSLDGYIEDARGGVDEVFAWLYGSGNAEVATPADDRKFKTSEASAAAAGRVEHPDSRRRERDHPPHVSRPVQSLT
jgi:hypothetical protein